MEQRAQKGKHPDFISVAEIKYPDCDCWLFLVVNLTTPGCLGTQGGSQTSGIN